MATPSARTLIGRQIGPYRVSALLGAGGMGEVYRAIDAIAIALTLAIVAPSCRSQARQTSEKAVLSEANQLLVVTTPDWTSINGQLQRYARSSVQAPWQPVGTRIPVVLGPHGLGWGSGVHGAPEIIAADAEPIKQEGDGKAPAGVFRLDSAFGYVTPEVASLKLPYVQATDSLVCVDDPESAQYNRVIDRRNVQIDWRSAEDMRRQDDLYQWGVIVEHNSVPMVPGRGSCIFLHVWAGPGIPTTGCTAMPGPSMKELLFWLDAAKRPLLVQLPETQLKRLRTTWGLP